MGKDAGRCWYRSNGFGTLLQAVESSCCCIEVGFGLGKGSGSANRTVGGEDLLHGFAPGVGVDLRLDFIDDRFGILFDDIEETLDS